MSPISLLPSFPDPLQIWTGSKVSWKLHKLLEIMTAFCFSSHLFEIAIICDNVEKNLYTRTVVTIRNVTILSFSRLRSVTCRWGEHLETSSPVTQSAAPWPRFWLKPPHSWSASYIAPTTGLIASTRPWSNGCTRSNLASESQRVRLAAEVRGWKRVARCRAERSTTPRERAKKPPRGRRRRGDAMDGSMAWGSCRSTSWGHSAPRCGRSWRSSAVLMQACVLVGVVCTSRQGDMRLCWEWWRRAAPQRRCSGTRQRSPSGTEQKFSVAPFSHRSLTFFVVYVTMFVIYWYPL